MFAKALHIMPVCHRFPPVENRSVHCVVLVLIHLSLPEQNKCASVRLLGVKLRWIFAGYFLARRKKL
jgi:hypothetical protein